MKTDESWEKVPVPVFCLSRWTAMETWHLSVFLIKQLFKKILIFFSFLLFGICALHLISHISFVWTNVAKVLSHRKKDILKPLCYSAAFWSAPCHVIENWLKTQRRILCKMKVRYSKTKMQYLNVCLYM